MEEFVERQIIALLVLGPAPPDRTEFTGRSGHHGEAHGSHIGTEGFPHSLGPGAVLSLHDLINRFQHLSWK